MTTTIIRTPEERFANLPDYNFKPNYALQDGVRMHYVDEGPREGETVLCLHGEPSWSYLYRKMIPILAKEYRTVAPDLIGFGKSDKYTETSAYSYQQQLSSLERFIEQADLTSVTIVVQDWGGLLGLPLATLHPHRIKRLVIMNTGLPGDLGMLMSLQGLGSVAAFMGWRTFSQLAPELPIGEIISAGCYPPMQLPGPIKAAYEAPFPSSEYKAGARIFPALVPILPFFAGADIAEAAREKLRSWQNPALVMFSDKDPITRSMREFFAKEIPGGVAPIDIKDAGHFLQEDKGEELARHIVNFIKTASYS